MNKKDRTLRDITHDMEYTAVSLKNIPQIFLKELQICNRNGFIKWIKTVIKGKSHNFSLISSYIFIQNIKLSS